MIRTIRGGTGSTGLIARAAVLLVAGLTGAVTLTACGSGGGAGLGQASAGRASQVVQAEDVVQANTTPVTRKKKKPVLSDRGFGRLRLGMSVKKARSQGLVGKKRPDKWNTWDGCAVYRGKKGANWVYAADGKVIIVDVSKKVRLKSGVRIGDTYAELLDAYGDRVGEDMGLGRIYVTAPKAPIPARYRIGLNTNDAKPGSKITEITLQSTERACYE